MLRGRRTHSPRLLFTLRLDGFGTSWLARPRFGGLLSSCCASWRANECRGGGPGRRRVRGSAAAPAGLPPLLVRPADPGGRAAVLVEDVPRVRGDLGARHSPAAVREPEAAEAVGDVLGDGAGGRPVP